MDTKESTIERSLSRREAIGMLGATGFVLLTGGSPDASTGNSMNGTTTSTTGSTGTTLTSSTGSAEADCTVAIHLPITNE